MNPYYNLPLKQRWGQRRVAQFNADEACWLRLEAKRWLRRRLLPNLSAKLREQLDLLDFANARGPQDCIGLFIEK